ncbi:dihydrolipoamide acetyltransferase family protein [Microbacterium testaceum]|uniref:dihydrolipoamide acetyltransferase family protein n=1 Tax=Microbacterium testaceum TaxID=2033 RepID=UPI003435063B
MIDILMPRLSDTMTEGAIATWHKKPGDAVAPGDVLLEIETDKALMEQEAYDSGILVEILVPEGENVAIGTPIARLDNGEGAGSTRDAPQREPAEAGATIARAAAPSTAEISATEPGAAASSVPARLVATPLVRRLAKERGLDLHAVVGSGPGGRIVRADLDRLEGPTETSTVDASTEPAPDARSAAGSVAVPFDSIRRAVATRLTESATKTPVFHATASADVTTLLDLREQINATLDTRVSVNDLVVRAVSLALEAHGTVNASYSPDGGGQTVIHEEINVGIAVASPAGLVVPVIRAPHRLSISSIARQTRELATQATQRTLTPEQMSGGTFTVSNLGMFGVESFTAIINPPQGAILAVGAIRDDLVLTENGVAQRKRLRYTLTSDHRIIDGADAGRFLATLTRLLETPLALIA